MITQILLLFQPYTHVTVTSDEEESSKKKEQTFTNNLNNKLSELSDSPQTDESKIESLDKKLQQQQVTTK